MTEFKTLNEKQAAFTLTAAEFVIWCHSQGLPVILAEAFRTEQQARWNAEQGIGVVRSNHRLKLAHDYFRVADGGVTWEPSEYQEIGAKWKSMHPLARWGGDFRNRDLVHFSFIHKGRM